MKEIEFKIEKMKTDGVKRFNVNVKYKLLRENKFKEHLFSFKNEDLKEDAFIDKIKKEIEKHYVDDPKVVEKKFEGKTFYHKLKGGVK